MRLLRRLAEMARRAWDAVRALVRVGWRMAVIRGELDGWEGRARPPMLVQIKVTNRCNMRCKMCGQWGETGYHKEWEGDQSIDLEIAKRFVDDARRIGADMTLWGGEPLVYRHLDELLAHARRRRTSMGIITNGLTLQRHAEMLVRHRVKDLIVSLDGPPEIHDEVRGVDGAFEKVVAGMHEVNRHKRALGLVRPTFNISTVVAEHTWRTLEPLLERLASEDLGIQHVVCTLRWWTDQSTGEAYERAMQRSFGCNAPSWSGFLVDPRPDIDVDELNGIFERIRGRKWPFKVVLHPKLTPEQVAVFFHNTTISFGRNHCASPWVYCLLLPSGELTFCPDFPDYRFGSLAEQPFDQLWNGDRAVAFRQRILEGLLPICPRCCGMYTTGSPWRRKRRSGGAAAEEVAPDDR